MDQPTYTALLRGQKWGDLHAQLTTYARRKMNVRNVSDVEDVVQQAITHVWDPEYQHWDPEREPVLLRFLMSHVNSLVVNGRRKAKRNPEAHKREKIIDAQVSTAPSPERAYELAELAERASTMLRERLAKADDKAGDELVTLFEEEVATPQEQASATGRPIDDIRFARRRVFRHADAIRDELGFSPDEVQ